MAADVVTPLIKAGVDLLTHALAHARRMLGKKKYEQLLSTTIAELLKEHPDIDEPKPASPRSKLRALRPIQVCCARNRCSNRS